MATIELHDLPPSPNNMKVRIALGYKGIPFESHPVDLADTERQGIVALSGQPLTPVVKHGDTVIYDSSAILRYLEANFRDTPPLLFADRPTMMEAEKLEKWARGPLTEPVGMIFAAAFAPEPDPDVSAKASALVHELTGEIEARLRGSDWLVGDRMSFVDVTAAPFVFYAMLPEAAAGTHPIAKFFFDNLHLGEGRDRTRAWAGRVMAFDRAPAATA